MKYSHERILCHPCSRLWKGEKVTDPRFKKKQSHKGPTIKFSTIARELDHMANCYEKKRLDRLSRATSDNEECQEKIPHKAPCVDDLYSKFVTGLEQDTILRRKVALYSACSKIKLTKSRRLNSEIIKMPKCDCYYCWKPQSESRQLLPCVHPQPMRMDQQKCEDPEYERKPCKEDEHAQPRKKWLVKKCGNSEYEQKPYKKYLVCPCSESSSMSCSRSEESVLGNHSYQDSEHSQNNGNGWKKIEYLVIENSETCESNSSLGSDLSHKSQIDYEYQEPQNGLGQHVIQHCGNGLATPFIKDCERIQNIFVYKFEHGT